MGRYIDAAYISNQYPSVTGGPPAEIVDASYIIPAEAKVDGLLSTKFSAPFSSNNATVKDLVADLAYSRLVTGKVKHWKDFEKRAMDTIQMLLDGKMNMTTTSGETITSDQAIAWSNVKDHHPVFGLSDPMFQSLDVDQVQAEHDERRNDG